MLSKTLRRPPSGLVNLLCRHQSTAPATSTSGTPSRPPPLPRRRAQGTGAAFQAFAADADLLTSETVSDRPSSSLPRNHDKPYLKPNVYAESFVVEETEIEPEPDVESELEKEKDVVAKPIPQQQQDPGIRYHRMQQDWTEYFTVERGGLVHFWQQPPLDSSSLVHDPTPSPGGKSAVISFARLRDNCRCPKCIHPTTRQKLHTSAEAYRQVRDTKYLTNRVPSRRNVRIARNNMGRYGIIIEWAPDHKTFYAWSMIRKLSHSRLDPFEYLDRDLPRRFWDGETLEPDSEGNLRMEYGQLLKEGEEGTYRLLSQLHRFGLVILRGVPTDSPSNEECALRKVANSIGEIRNSFYGETWDVKSVKESKNVAYTDLDLGLHMDLLYFSSPPRFQMLHCLRNRVHGGESYFVDSTKVAHELRLQRPHLYHLLRNKAIRFEYDNDGHYLTHSHKVVEDPGGDSHLSSFQAVVNWSPPFQAPTDGFSPPSFDVPKAKMTEDKVYQAWEEFDRRLNAQNERFEIKMEEGDLVVFDNRRILHARKSFRDWTAKEAAEARAEGRETRTAEGEPTRWLKGCYLDGETVWDKLVVLGRRDRERKGREEDTD
ncbi:hypothetical protein P7C73_g6081, partial [Tremellales sp. Uapishka_1]